MRPECRRKVGACEFARVMPHDISRCAEHKGCRPAFDLEQAFPGPVVVCKTDALCGPDLGKLIRSKHANDGRCGIGALAFQQGTRQEIQMSDRLLIGEMNDQVGPGPGRATLGGPQRGVAKDLKGPRGRELSQSYVRTALASRPKAHVARPTALATPGTDPAPRYYGDTVALANCTAHRLLDDRTRGRYLGTLDGEAD